jgi:hypothetical protein
MVTPLVTSTINLHCSILSQVSYLRAGNSRLHSVQDHRLTSHNYSAVPKPFHSNSELVIWKQVIINSSPVPSSYQIFICLNKHKLFCLNLQRYI